MIVILAKHPAWGAADNFYRAFKSCGYDVVLLCSTKDKFGRTNNENIITKMTTVNIDYYLKKASMVLICSPVTLATITKKIDSKISEKLKNVKNKIMFITGTDYIKNAKSWNKHLEKLKFNKIFSEAEMISFNPKINKFLPHPMEYDIDITKSDKITISHAPGMIERPEKKGTPIILSVIDMLREKYDFDYDHIVGVSFSECLKRKAKSHIFIDQINPNVGGIGKNGYEGLALNCVTLASVDGFKNIIHKHDIPPVINVVNGKELFYNLDVLLKNREYLNQKIEEISKWKVNINYKNTVKKLLE